MKPPRSTTNTGIPGLLQTFQNEWDALMLETFNLKQQLDSVSNQSDYIISIIESIISLLYSLSSLFYPLVLIVSNPN